MSMNPGRPLNRCWPAARSGVEAWSSAWFDHAPPKHSHDAYQISLTRAGAGRFVWRGRSLPCPQGRLVVIEPGEAHEVFPEGASPWEFDTLYLDEEAVWSVGGQSSPTTLAAIDGRLAARFSLLHKAVANRLSTIEQDEYLMGLIHALDDGRGRPHCRPTCPAVLRRVREFLDECPDGDVSLADLSALAELSPSHLSRSFRRAFGLPPHAYLVQARVRRARALLRRGTPVVEAAARVGFADQAHLTRHFRRLVGITPGRYRSEGRNVQDQSGQALYP